MTLFSGIFGLVTILHALEGKHCRGYRLAESPIPYISVRILPA